MKGTSQSVKLIGVHIKYIIRPRSSIPPLVITTRDNVFSESRLSGEYFGWLVATGEWGVCL